MLHSLIILLVFQSIILLLEAIILNLQTKLNHIRKGLTNIQNINDNECFKWCLVRYLNPEDRNQTRTTKADKDSSKKFDFKGVKSAVKVRDIHKTEKKNSIGISDFGYGK